MTCSRLLAVVLGCLIIVAVPARAATLTLQLAATSGTQVVPGGIVAYEIRGALSADSQGLAGFCVDLLTDTGRTPAQASPGTVLGTAFSTNGFTDPAGFGGTATGDDLLGIGGAQNTIGNDGTLPNPAQPSGSAVVNIAVGSEVVLASGSLTMPQEVGTYTISLVNASGAAITGGSDPVYTVAETTTTIATASFQVEVTTDPIISSLVASPVTGTDAFANTFYMHVSPATNDLTLTATVSDDGQPAPLTYQWGVSSATIPVWGSLNFGTADALTSFESPTSATTRVRFSRNGMYTLQCAAYDGQCTTTGEITVRVTSCDIDASGGNVNAFDRGMMNAAFGSSTIDPWCDLDGSGGNVNAGDRSCMTASFSYPYTIAAYGTDAQDWQSADAGLGQALMSIDQPQQMTSAGSGDSTPDVAGSLDLEACEVLRQAAGLLQEMLDDLAVPGVSEDLDGQGLLGPYTARVNYLQTLGNGGQ